MMRTLWAIMLVLLLPAQFLQAAGESGPVDENSLKKHWPSEGEIGIKFRDTAGQLRCPTCTGLSILESDARFSQQIKQIVLEQVEAGKSKDEILQYFTDRYGAWILRAPPAKGFNLVAWAVPLALMFFGPLLVWLFVWRRPKTSAEGASMRKRDDIIAEFKARLAKGDF